MDCDLKHPRSVLPLYFIYCINQGISLQAHHRAAPLVRGARTRTCVPLARHASPGAIPLLFLTRSPALLALAVSKPTPPSALSD